MADGSVAIEEPDFDTGTMTVEDLVRRSAEIYKVQQNWLHLCQAIAEIFYPERADFTTKRVFGDEMYNFIFDGEPIRLRQELANSLGVMLRRRGEDWFQVKAYPSELNELYGVQQWCSQATQTMREIVYAPEAMFTKAMMESDNDYVAFGTSVVSHTYNQAGDGLFFKTHHLRDCAWVESDEGKIDEVHLKGLWTPWRLAQVFGKDKLPKEIKDKLRLTPHTKDVQTLRVVAPIGRYSVEGTERYPRDAKYCSIYVLPGQQAVLGVGHFKVFPFLVRRWLTVTDEPFGRSMCTGVAMADSRLLNQAMISIIDSLEKAVNPPMFAPHDGIVGDVQIRASGITYYDPELDYGSRRPIEVLPPGRADMGMDFAANRRDFLGRVFFQNILKLPVDHEMTAYETEQRIEEIVRSASPIIEPMENENAQLLDACFERALDRNAFVQPPAELDGAEVRFEFETPVSIARRKLKAQKASGVIQHIGVVAQMDPGAIDLIDWDDLNRDAIGGIGDVKWLKDPKDVESARQARAQAQEQARQEALLLQQQELAANAKNKVPGHGKPGEMSPLDAV